MPSGANNEGAEKLFYIKASEQRMKDIQAVLLDVDNTILDFNIGAMEAMRATFLEWKLPFSEDMFSVFLTCNQKLWEDIEKNKLTREELYKIRWKIIFGALDISGPDPVQFDEVFRKNLGESAAPVEGAYALLEYLSRKYTLCIASNAAYERQVKRLEKANMLSYIRHVFSSEKIGHPKPEKAFFDACLSSLDGILPQETVVIGDSLTADIAGGNESGMKTIWYNHNREEIPLDVQPDYTVYALKEILDIL